MTLTVAGREIAQVAVVDDNEGGRGAFALVMEDLGTRPVEVEGPVSSVDDVLKYLDNGGGVICDHHMTVSRYSEINGAELAAGVYSTRRPVVLCTAWEEAHIEEMRVYRPAIPVLLRPDDLSPDVVEEAFRVCIEEYSGVLLPRRKPRRTLVRIEEVDAERHLVFVVVPAWDAHQVVRLPFECFPSGIDFSSIPGRVFAKVNIGTERHEDLYFIDWELDS